MLYNQLILLPHLFYLLFPKNNWLVSFHEERGKEIFLIRVKPAEKVVISEQGNKCFQDNKPNVVRNFRGKTYQPPSLSLAIHLGSLQLPNKSHGIRVGKFGDF